MSDYPWYLWGLGPVSTKPAADGERASSCPVSYEGAAMSETPQPEGLGQALVAQLRAEVKAIDNPPVGFVTWHGKLRDLLWEAADMIERLSTASPAPASPPPDERRKLHEAIALAIGYRAHRSGCEIDQTDFCSCGLREAMERLDKTWRSQQPASPPGERPDQPKVSR